MDARALPVLETPTDRVRYRYTCGVAISHCETSAAGDVCAHETWRGAVERRHGRKETLERRESDAFEVVLGSCIHLEGEGMERYSSLLGVCRAPPTLAVSVRASYPHIRIGWETART